MGSVTQSRSDGRRPVHTEDAPPPAGPYSRAIVAGGLVFVARLSDAPCHAHARQVLDGLEAGAVVEASAIAVVPGAA